LRAAAAGARPKDDEVAEVVAAIARRTIGHLQRRGLLDADGEVVSRPDGDELVDSDRAMSMATQASVFNKVAFGPRAGRMVRKIGKGFRLACYGNVLFRHDFRNFGNFRKE
jgi:hypothetical protein